MAAAEYAVPQSIFICSWMRECRLLKDLCVPRNGSTIETTQFVGMDFDNPSLNMQAIAEGFGARTEKIDNSGPSMTSLSRALAHPGSTT